MAGAPPSPPFAGKVDLLMSRKVYVVRLRRRPRRATRGQSLVEFAIVSIVLLMLILGIIEMGRLLFVYSVVSNAAHEGVRYGIIRPQDLYARYEMETRVAQGTAVPTAVVVDNGRCNVVDKAREKVWLVPKNELIVNVWFDNGNGTPTVLPSGIDKVTDLVPYVGEQNRIAVETKYRYQFIVPFVSVFAPNGIDIKMRAARTIENFEFDPRPCAMDWNPAFTPVPRPTYTPVPTETPRPTRTPTISPTSPPPTITRTPSRTPTSAPATITVTPSVTGTNTPVPPTATNASIPPTVTNTPVPPTATNPSVPPTMTNTPTTAPPTVTVTRTITTTPSPTPTTNIALPSPPATSEALP